MMNDHKILAIVWAFDAAAVYVAIEETAKAIKHKFRN